MPSVSPADSFARHARAIYLPALLMATLIGAMGCSTPALRKDFAVRAIERSAPLRHDEVVEVIASAAKKKGLRKGEANPPHWEGSFSGRGIFLTYSFPTPNEVAVGIQANRGSFGNGEVRRAESLRNAIRQSLDLQFKGLEYSELPVDH